jgi:hypothetical protein
VIIKIFDRYGKRWARCAKLMKIVRWDMTCQAASGPMLPSLALSSSATSRSITSFILFYTDEHYRRLLYLAGILKNVALYM